MSRRRRRRVTVAAAGLAAVTIVAWADAAASPRNLVATAAVKAQLREAHLRLVPLAARRTVQGPLKGLTFYGSYGSTRYAVATFSHAGVGTTDQPELFSKPSGKPWRDRGDTGGCISSTIIPSALLRLWGFRRDSLNRDCFERG